LVSDEITDKPFILYIGLKAIIEKYGTGENALDDLFGTISFIYSKK
jgi:hypothetical protein